MTRQKKVREKCHAIRLDAHNYRNWNTHLINGHVEQKHRFLRITSSIRSIQIFTKHLSLY